MPPPSFYLLPEGPRPAGESLDLMKKLAKGKNICYTVAEITVDETKVEKLPPLIRQNRPLFASERLIFHNFKQKIYNFGRFWAVYSAKEVTTMEKSTAPRARFIAAILLFAAVIIVDLILSRGYLAQGPATWPVFLLLELVMLALLVIGGILFCNRRGLDTNKKLILGFGFFLVWCILTVIFFADYKALYLSTLHTEYPSYGAAITCLKLVLVLCGLTALIPVAPAPTGRAYADGLARAYQKQNIEQAKTAAAEAQKDLERRVEQLRSSMSPEELEALTRKLKQESAPAAVEESHEKTEEK